MLPPELEAFWPGLCWSKLPSSFISAITLGDNLKGRQKPLARLHEKNPYSREAGHDIASIKNFLCKPG